MKKLLSTILTVLLLCGCVLPLLPVNASAAYSTEVAEDSSLSLSDIQSIVSKTVGYNFNSAEEMLNYELEKGYLDSVSCKDNLYTIYANRYTGLVYYVNNVTGEIITTNPYNPAYLSASTGKPSVTDAYRQSLMSQLVIEFQEAANSTNKQVFESLSASASAGQISVDPIAGGLRVNYTLGDTSQRFLLPGRITAEKYEKDIFNPIFAAVGDLFERYFGTDSYDGFVFQYKDSEDYVRYVDGCLNDSTKNGFRAFLSKADSIAKLGLKDHVITTSEQKILSSLIASVTTFVGKYTLKNPNKSGSGSQSVIDKMKETYPITAEGIAIYVYKEDDQVANQRASAALITKYCAEYTFNQMYTDEKECGYEAEVISKPVFRCSLEYSFNSDGSMSIRLPANSITFDETIYVLTAVTPLKFFNASDMSGEGYFFFPDGSGTVIEYKDFYNAKRKTSLNLGCSVFGQDYVYSKITGAHREQITMPVYGAVSMRTANETTNLNYGVDTVMNGYFAILEEGASLASVCFSSGGDQYKFGAVYASYKPRPSDTYDLSDTISVGSLGEYIIVADSKYSGSYVTRIVMLNDDTVGAAAYGAGKYYPATYVGMAGYYRDYLKANGTLKALADVEENLPLYIESLGSMKITTKILSFPVTKTIALTSFEDVKTMYNELSDCKAYAQQKADEYKALAEAEEDDTQKASYERSAALYAQLALEAKNITNINFKLTGFANGGMYYTYPAKIRWEKVLGGKKGFSDLVSSAEEISAKDGYHFGVYPEFDFMYINNTAMFDGISVKGNVSCMVDNRYASKQTYDSVRQDYTSNFTLVISPDALDRLYSGFSSKYHQYDIKTISASTLGADLNSNFDEDNSINRDQAQQYVSETLRHLASVDEYELMIDTGNIYAVRYATHILNAAIDSSHFRYSSYAIPFIGLVMHGYVNYAGSALNYSGAPSYDLLRSIESGASLYYILCYQNTANLKDDHNLNKYYGVDYANWFAKLISTYNELNDAIGSLQTYEISDHKTLIAERIIDESEQAENYVTLEKEYIELIRAQAAEKLEAAFDDLRAAGDTDSRVKLVIDIDAILAEAADILNRTTEDFAEDGFAAAVAVVAAEIEAEYPGLAGHDYVVTFDSVDYATQYSYLTDSFATDKDYVLTDYTCTNGNVAMVTYSNGTDTVYFVLNYNVYSVNVKLDAQHSFELGKYSFVKLDKNFEIVMRGGENA